MRSSATIHPVAEEASDPSRTITPPSEDGDGSYTFNTRPQGRVHVHEEVARQKSKTGQSLERAATGVGARLSSHQQPRMSERSSVPGELASPSYSSDDASAEAARTESVFNFGSATRSHTLKLPELSVYTLAFVGPTSRPSTSYDWTPAKTILGKEHRHQPRKWSAVMVMITVLQCYLPLLYVLSLQSFVLYTLWQVSTLRLYHL